MESLSWMAALALLSVAPSPAKDSVPPTQRPEDRPAHESPYSAFGAPHAKRAKSARRPGARLHCKDGTVQTQGQRGAKAACADHGGVK